MTEGRLVYEDSEVEIRCDSGEMEGYILYFKKTELQSQKSGMLIEGGVLKYIGEADEHDAGTALKSLLLSCNFINAKRNEMGLETIISAIKKAYVLEKKN